MKFTIKREILLEALNKVSKAISTKNLIPTLSGIKFDLTKKGLILTASNNDITIQKTIKVKDNNIIVSRDDNLYRYNDDVGFVNIIKYNELKYNFENIYDYKK